MLLISFSVVMMNLSLWSTTKGMPIQSNVEKGYYIPKIPLKIKDLRNLPVPSTNEDYAFLQSIDNDCSVVIGKFSTGMREIILIKDRNSDGKVDLVVHWFVDKKRYKYSSRPGSEYSRDKFKAIKQNIINGKKGELNPNKEGTEYIKVLEQDSDRIKRWKNGYRVRLLDADDASSERLNFFFSTSNAGADLVFEIKYRNQGVMRISPIINYSVYCRESKDAMILETTKSLIKEASKFVPVID